MIFLEPLLAYYKLVVFFFVIEMKFCVLFVRISLGHIKIHSQARMHMHSNKSIHYPYNLCTISYTTEIFPQESLSTLNNSIPAMLCQFVSPEQHHNHTESSDHSPSIQVSALIVMKYSLIPLKSTAHSPGFCTLRLEKERKIQGSPELNQIL